jgi:hypothetical protein
MANPWFGSDVAAGPHLATLRAAVVQRPLVASKISTAMLAAGPAHAQRISFHLQQLKARLLPRNNCPPKLPHHTILQYQKVKKTKKEHSYRLSRRLRIWPILGSAVTSLQDKLLPR